MATWEIWACVLALVSGTLFGISKGHEPMASLTILGGIAAGVVFRFGKQKEVYRNATAANPITWATPLGLASYSLLMAGGFFMVGCGIVYRLG